MATIKISRPAPASKESFDRPLISLVLPTFNHEKFIIESLNSLALQTYSPLELIIVDDHSQDNTPRLILQWLQSSALAKRFEGRVLFFRQPRNIGAHYTLNSGVSFSSGKYIQFLNSDDILHPERCNLMFEAVQREKLEIGFSRIRVIDGRGRPITSLQDPFVRDIELGQSRFVKTLPQWLSLIDQNHAVTTGNIFVSRAIFDVIGGFDALKYCHDWDFVLKGASRFGVLFVDKYLYYYRLHGNNTILLASENERIEESKHIIEAARRMYSSAGAKVKGDGCPHNWPVVSRSWP